MGRKEIAHYEQFLLFPLCFQKTCNADMYCRYKKPGFVWDRVNSLPNNKFLDWSKLKAFADNKINLTSTQNFFLGLVENIVGKGENAGH